MSSELHKKIIKTWKRGQCNSKRELVNTVCEEMGIDINSKNQYIQETIWVIKRIADNVIQGGNGQFWRK